MGARIALVTGATGGIGRAFAEQLLRDGDVDELWAVARTHEKLERLRDELASRNVPFDAKPFKPHITLARRARIPKASLPPLAFPRDDRACTATLYKSTLERTGAVYKPLHSARLDG